MGSEAFEVRQHHDNRVEVSSDLHHGTARYLEIVYCGALSPPRALLVVTDAEILFFALAPPKASFASKAFVGAAAPTRGPRAAKAVRTRTSGGGVGSGSSALAGTAAVYLRCLSLGGLGRGARDGGEAAASPQREPGRHRRTPQPPPDYKHEQLQEPSRWHVGPALRLDLRRVSFVGFRAPTKASAPLHSKGSHLPGLDLLGWSWGPSPTVCGTLVEGDAADLVRPSSSNNISSMVSYYFHALCCLALACAVEAGNSFWPAYLDCYTTAPFPRRITQVVEVDGMLGLGLAGAGSPRKQTFRLAPCERSSCLPVALSALWHRAIASAAAGLLVGHSLGHRRRGALRAPMEPPPPPPPPQQQQQQHANPQDRERRQHSHPQQRQGGRLLEQGRWGALAWLPPAACLGAPSSAGAADGFLSGVLASLRTLDGNWHGLGAQCRLLAGCEARLLRDGAVKGAFLGGHGLFTWVRRRHLPVHMFLLPR